MPGSVQKVQCEAYDYNVQETGEVISLTHRYEYVEEQRVIKADVTKLYKTSTNGSLAEVGWFVN